LNQHVGIVLGFEKNILCPKIIFCPILIQFTCFGLHLCLQVPDFLGRPTRFVSLLQNSMCILLKTYDLNITIVFRIGTAEILEKLLKRPETTLMAFQIGFDLYESATQQFLTSVRNSLKLVSSTTAAPVDSTADQEAESMDTDESTPTESTATASKEGTPNGTHDANGTGDLKKLAAILSGDTTISLHLQFLIRNNQTDLLILKKTKETVILISVVLKSSTGCFGDFPDTKNTLSLEPRFYENIPSGA
jgi:hypothetical protein